MKTLLEKYYHWLAAALLLIHTAINIYCTTRLSITGDELAYYAYGVNMLKGQPQKTLNAQGIPIFNSQMPVNALHALPRAVEQVLRPGLQKSGAAANRDIYHGRLMSVAAALLLGLYIIVWATQLYGRSAGLLSLLLYCCSPNLLAHSQLVGTDAFSYLATMATCYHAWRYARHGGWQSFLYMGLWLGLGQLIKQSLLLLYPVVAVLLLLRPISGGPGRWGIKAVRWTKEMMAVALVSLVVINIGFGGKVSGQALKEYQFVSAPYQGLQQHLGWFSKLPLPLPAPYLQGFDYVAFNVATGPGIEGRSSYGSNYVLGQKTDGRWLWYYYPLCWWYKMPLGFGLLVMVALWGYGRRRKRDFWQSGVFLLWPVLFIAVMFICCNTMYLGIRSTLLVEPLLLVCCGSVAPLINNRLRAWLLALLLAAQLVSVGRWFPHFLPYTNEWLWHKKDAHTVFTDSNIYFQEAGILVQEYLRRHPDVQYEPVQPVTGKVLVSVEAYYDWWNQGRMQWLRDLRLEPVGHLDSGHLLFWVGSK